MLHLLSNLALFGRSEVFPDGNLFCVGLTLPRTLLLGRRCLLSVCVVHRSGFLGDYGVGIDRKATGFGRYRARPWRSKVRVKSNVVSSCSKLNKTPFMGAGCMLDVQREPRRCPLAVERVPTGRRPAEFGRFRAVRRQSKARAVGHMAPAAPTLGPTPSMRCTCMVHAQDAPR